MGRPITGQWVRTHANAYTGTAAKWGTGIKGIHAFYGEGEPLRTYGRNQQIPDITPPSAASPDFVETGPPWGYNPHDLAGLDVYADEYAAVNGVQFVQDDWPDWGEETTETRANIPVDSSRPWGSSGGFKNVLRSVIAGPGQINTLGSGFSYEIPTETVSEGWLNKPASGMGDGVIPDSNPSDASQIFVQTSQTQRYKQQENVRAVMRGTDDDREPIQSRLAPMKLKVYSGQERHYDMDPRQITQRPKEFWYRHAATGDPATMDPNEMIVLSPIQRSVPPDPSLGTSQDDLSEFNDGYTPEDVGYY